MKKNIVGVIAVVAIAAMAGYNVYSSQNDGKLSDLALANVEALASGESGGWACPDACKEWSGNSGGGIACDCNRYTGKCKARC